MPKELNIEGLGVVTKIDNSAAIMEGNMPTISEQVKFYDAFWRDHTLISYWGMERTGVILTELARQRIDSPNILDLGCGTGWLSNILSNYGTVTGIELSVEAIAAAKERFPQVKFVSGDFFAIDLDDKFDFKTDEGYKEFRSDLINGVLRHDHCSECYRYENTGAFSGSGKPD